jgi:hypothetical protein
MTSPNTVLHPEDVVSIVRPRLSNRATERVTPYKPTDVGTWGVSRRWPVEQVSILVGGVFVVCLVKMPQLA